MFANAQLPVSQLSLLNSKLLRKMLKIAAQLLKYLALYLAQLRKNNFLAYKMLKAIKAMAFFFAK
jgi:hypothetical protein